MPPKTKAKKGRKQDDEDFWEKAGEAVAPNSAAPAAEPDDDEYSKPRGGFSAFAGLADESPEVADEDFGGLMSTLKASSTKQKDKKKGKKGKADALSVEDFEERPAEDVPSPNGHASPPPAPVQMTAEDLADEEWGPVKQKGNQKDKKGGKGKPAASLEDTQTRTPDEQASVMPADVTKPYAAPAVAASEPLADDDDDETGPKVLSKKEKEKLKKEREKAKKKAQAEMKKGETIAEERPPPEPSQPSKDEEEEEEGDAEDGAVDKKKKKKKKKKAGEGNEAEEKKEDAKSGKKTKVSAAIAALRAAQEAQRLAEEEAQRIAEEERKRLEEEERKRQEEERLKEEAKQRKKEKEKAKKEQAKKEGRYMTKKQKEEKAAAEARMKSLIESGVRIEGLQSGGAPAKKFAQSNRKKKGPTPAKGNTADERASTPTSPLPDATPEITTRELPASTPPTESVSVSVEDDKVKDSWDVSDEESAPAEDIQNGVKDSWDASSEDEATVEVPSIPAMPVTNGEGGKASKPKAEAEPVKIDVTPSKTKEALQLTPAPPKEKVVESKMAPTAAPVAEEEEEEESDEESESDSGSDDGSDVDLEESDEEGMTTAQRIAAQRKAEAAERRAKRHEEALAARNKDDLRSPICCILGHVDTGKTKLLDKIRQTNVQEGEAGGITQQIGATYFPVEAIRQKTLVLNQDGSQEYKIPGLLIIDTPGHESFTNLRTRGSSLCNIAILVVDIMHGLEPQTLESLRLLRDRKTPFIVALNKIDRLYGWTPTPDGGFRESLAKQKPAVQREFQDRVEKIVLAFAEQGLNSVLYYENKRFDRNVSIVPTSAITGEGIPDMIMLLVNLTQQRMSDRLMYLSELECTVLEVKVIEGLGTTIDVVLSNGVLHEGDRIVVCGLDGPISTQVRALLTPQPLRELRIKSVYVHHKEVKAALGVKITAPGLEKAIAGSRLLVVGPDDDEDDLRDEVMSDLTSLLNNIDKSGRGVCVQASTLGSLEALLDFLKSSKIPVSGINIGPVHKRDVMRAATMLERARELACILCFDVDVDKEAEKLAEEMGVRLFKADIIYHLFDAFTAYNAEMVEAKRRDAAPQAIWPCRLKIIAAFAKRDPIILGVDILDGSLRVGTPLCVVKVDPVTQKKDIIDLGKITSLEINHKSMEVIKKSQAGGGVAVKIEHAVYQSAKMYGRHFDDKDELLSHVTRTSIDVLKENFRDDVSKEEWKLIVALKQRLDIQ